MEGLERQLKVILKKEGEGNAHFTDYNKENRKWEQEDKII